MICSFHSLFAYFTPPSDSEHANNALINSFPLWVKGLICTVIVTPIYRWVEEMSYLARGDGDVVAMLLEEMKFERGTLKKSVW